MYGKDRLSSIQGPYLPSAQAAAEAEKAEKEPAPVDPLKKARADLRSRLVRGGRKLR